MPPEECRQGQMNFVREGMERRYGSMEYGSPVHVGKSSMKCFREAFLGAQEAECWKGTHQGMEERRQKTNFVSFLVLPELTSPAT